MNKDNPPNWVLIPFARDFVALAAIVTLAPVVVAIYLYHQELATAAFVLGGLWSVFFVFIAAKLHTYGVVRLPVSVGCALATIVVFSFFFSEK